MSAMEAHREIHFEDFIADHLAGHRWLLGDAARYDRLRALYPEDVVGYLQDTSPRPGRSFKSSTVVPPRS